MIGYGLSAITKPFFYFASSWGLVAAVRWADRVGKGIRTAPRDALVADSVTKETRGLAFGFNRAMDKAGAFLGLLIAALVVWLAQANNINLSKFTFQTIVLISLVPAFLAVLSLAIGARDVVVKGQRTAPKFSLRSMGKPFQIFLVIVSVFTLGNSADSFLVLRAQNLGVSVTGILIMLAVYNLIITLVATPAGSLSDRVGRRRLIIGGWYMRPSILVLLWRKAHGMYGCYTLLTVYILAWLLYNQCDGRRSGPRKLARNGVWNV